MPDAMNDAQVASGEQAASLQAAGSARKRSYDRAYNKMRPVKLTRQVNEWAAQEGK